MDALKTTFAEISLVNDEIEQTDAKSVAIEEEIRHLQSLKDQNQDFVNLQSLLNTDGDLERFNATKNALFEHLSANPTQFNWNEGREANEEAACAEEGEAETADH